MTSIMKVFTASGLAMLLTACAELQYPTQASVSAQVNALPDLHDANAARGYIAAARATLLSSRSHLNVEEGLTDVGISGGAVFTVLGGALHWASRTIIDTTVVSGTSYALSQTRRPRAQLDILDGSLATLDCIGSKAETGYGSASARTVLLHPIVAAEAAVARDKANPFAQDPNDTANDALKNAKAFIDANQPGIYQQVRVAVDATLTSAFTQMRKATADSTAVQQAFAGVTAVQSAPSSTTGTTVTLGKPDVPSTVPQPAPGAKKAELAAVAALNLRAAATTQLIGDIGVLEAAIKVAQQSIDIAPAGSQALDLQACAPGAIILIINPSSDIAISPGQTYGFTVTGGQHAWSWSGTAPDPNLLTVRQSSSSVYTLSADLKLNPSQSFALMFTPFADGPPKVLAVKVVAAASGH